MYLLQESRKAAQDMSKPNHQEIFITEIAETFKKNNDINF
jgi:hypothetical protein